ncbi:MAG: type II toxin-antitoxin system Phd/YefM family antitoxin [Halioglobus sp.]|nr:type II toxin-antitoxin system Phd/YefM family antitoxin [Halioglobus sp.]
MMEIVNMHEAKTRLSQLVDKAAKGEPVVIARAGKPVARLTAIDSPGPGEQRRTGFLAGQFAVPDDFDRMGDAQIAEMFGG